MCYAIPAKLIEIKKNIGVVDYLGEKRNILLDGTDVAVGDYVYAQGGIFVSKIAEAEALSILDTWKEIFFELKKTDEAMAKLDETKISQNALAVLQKVNLRKNLSKDELLSLFNLTSQNELTVLYEIANNVRQREHGNASCVHGIIEFSNYCSQKCFYCGIRQENEIKRFRIEPEEIINIAKKAVKNYGFKALVLQSGEDYFYTDEILAHIVKEIRKLGVLVFLSLGSRSKETYKKLFEAGARAALVRFETSNPDIFASLRPNTTLDERIDLIKYLRQLGYVIATGFILGLPGEKNEDIVNNILLTKSLGPDMYSFGPLIPTSGTPLEKEQKINKEQVLKTIAIARMADSNSNILVTTALETLDNSAKKEALLSGANSMMVNVTPDNYKKLYKIYDDRAGSDLNLATSIQNVVDLLFNLGRAPTDIGVI
jgi:biotin synthase